MKYRREIDGLRAVAILPVVLFHTGIGAFSGGYVGVDVFFVISGYLITTILMQELEAGSLTLAGFYERRARRILPALFLVMLVTIPFAWRLLLPGDMLDYAQSVGAISLFSSNVLFWQEAGYWGATGELKPLLHTWSLAVEEQYYLLFPIFLLALWRFGKSRLLLALVSVAVLSLLVAQWGSKHWPIAAFYLLPTRAWELALGAGCAILRSSQAEAPMPRSEWLAGTGLALIGFAVWRFDENTEVPGASALVPTLGAVLVVLFASERTFAGRILGSRLLVGIGLISYSAYLWHQPLFAFARHASLTELSRNYACQLALASFALAWMSWKFVEVPFRDRRRFSRQQVFGFAAVGAVAFLAFALVGQYSNGYEMRQSHGVSAQVIAEKLVPNKGLDEHCDLRAFELLPECRTSDRPQVLLWGDSYAMQLAPALQQAWPGVGLVQMTKATCGSFFDIAPLSNPERDANFAPACLNFNQQVREWLRVHKSVRYALVSANFARYKEMESGVRTRSGAVVQPTDRWLAARLLDTLRELKAAGINPVVVSPLPTTGRNLGRCLSRAEWTGRDLSLCDFRKGAASDAMRSADLILDEVEASGFSVVRLDAMFCDADWCRSHEGSTYIYRDARHLSQAGAALLGARVDLRRLLAEGTAQVADPRLSAAGSPTPRGAE
jgi:peptidoglycan/LPS O-acetylase OafA/YrhL